MDYREILELIRSIQSAEDFQEKRDVLFKNLEQFVSTNLDTLRKLQGSELSQDEIKIEFAKFQQDWETMGLALEPEFNRLDTIPGISQLSESVQEEFIKRIEPMAKEGEEIMIRLRAEGATGTPRPPPPREKIERQRLDELETLYSIKSIEELKTSQDLIFDAIGNKMKDILQKLRSFKNKPSEEYMTEFNEIERYLDVFDNEGKSEFERLQALPGGVEYFETFMGVLQGRLGPILDEIEQLQKELK